MRVSSARTQGFQTRDVLQTMGTLGLCATTIGAGSNAFAQSNDAEASRPDPSSASVSEVVVTGVRPLLGEKLPETLQNTPQSVTVVSDKLMQAQGVTRLQDALKNVPGVTLNAGEGAARGDTVNLRGFSAFNDFFLDGIRDAAVYGRDSFNLQEIEVLKGPSATLFGRGSTGGAINQVSKAATLDPLRTITAEVGSNDDYRATVDLDQPISPSAAFRLNAMSETSDVADRDDVKNRRWGVAPTLAFGIGGPTTLTLAYLHQQEDNIPDVGVPFVDGRPAPVRRDADFGLASDRATTDDDIVTARLKHDFSPNLSIADTVRYANYAFNYQFDAPNFGDTAPTADTPLSSIRVARDSPSSSGVQTNLTEQLDLAARFDTGIFHHVLVTGIELARQTNSLDRYNNPFDSNENWIPETPLLDPNPNEAARPSQPVTSIQDTTAYSQAIYATDTIGIGRYLDLIAGIRLDRFAATYNELSVASGALLHLDHVDRVASPHVALVFKPTPTKSFYFSYGTSFDPSAEALTLTTQTANLGPQKGTTYEVGTKTTWLHGGLLLTGALFRTEVDNTQTNDPINPTITVLNGDQRVQGVELGAVGHLTSKLSINAGYTWLDGETIASGTPADVGKVMQNLARNAVNLWAEYHLSSAWEVGVGGNYLGKRYADFAQAAAVPSSIVWNTMASYRINPRLKLQLNAINLFDKHYYDGLYYVSAAENHAVPGAGRTVKLSVQASF